MADVKIRHKDGRFGSVPEANLSRAEALGWRPETEKDATERAAGTELEAIGQGAVVGAIGTALAAPKVASSLGSAILGTEDPLANFTGRGAYTDIKAAIAHATAGGDPGGTPEQRRAHELDRLRVLERAQGDTRESLIANEQEHPVSFIAGEIAGGIAPGLPLGGVAAGLAARGVAAAGLTGRAATIAGMAGAGILEGGVLGGEMAHEQAWIRNETATAEQTLAGIGMGALFGGTIGGGLGAWATRGARAGSKLSVAEALGDARPPRGVLADDAAEAGESALEGAAKGWRGRLEEKARVAIDNEAVEAIGARDAQAMRRLSNDVAERRRIGAVLNDLDITGAKTEGLGRGIIGRSPEEMLARAETLAASRGKELGDDLDRLSKYIGPVKATEPLGVVRKYVNGLREAATVDTERQVAERIARELAPFEEKLGLGAFKTTEAVGGKRMVVPARDSGMRDVTLREVHKLRTTIDKLIKYERRNPTNADEALQGLRGEIEDWIKSKIQAAGEQEGATELVARYQRVKDEYRAARWAEETLTERVMRDQKNSKLSLGDRLSGAAGIGAAVATGSPLAALAAGAVGAIANKSLRQRGSNTVIALGRRLLREQTVDAGMAPAMYRRTASAVGDVVDGVQGDVDANVGRFLGSGPKRLPPGPDAKKSSAMIIRTRGAKAYADHAREVLSMADPEIAADRLNKAVGYELANAAPGLYAAMASVATRAAGYLAANLPAPPVDPNSITPHLDEPPPVSRSDLQAYADRVEGVEDPLSLMRDLNRGRVSPEKVDAVKTVYPDMFAMMRKAVFMHLAERKKTVPYEQRKLLDLALDGDGQLEPSLRGDSLQVMRMVGEQMAKVAQQKQQQGNIPQLSNTLATQSQRIAMR